MSRDSNPELVRYDRGTRGLGYFLRKMSTLGKDDTKSNSAWDSDPHSFSIKDDTFPGHGSSAEVCVLEVFRTSVSNYGWSRKTPTWGVHCTT